MKTLASSQIVVGILFLLCVAIAPANATVDHTYVSGKGTDTGGCVDQATACRTFAYAITQTAPSGEIIAIDAADYSPVTITKSISVVAQGGGPAGVIVSAGNAITISAGATGVVNLRGLTLDGDGTAAAGIALNSAGSLTISDCSAQNFQNSGILLTPYPTLQIFSKVNVSIVDSVLDNNGTGLSITGTGFLETILTLRNLTTNYNGTGISVTGAGVTLADSVVTGNTEYGIFVGPINGDVSHSALYSYGDNEINNGTNISGGTLTAIAKQ
jgi:hypothetical protein